MRIQKQQLTSRLITLVIVAGVIGLTWYVYEDYVNTTNAQPLQGQQVENKVTEQNGTNVVQGVVEIAPKPKGILIVPAE